MDWALTIARPTTAARVDIGDRVFIPRGDETPEGVLDVDTIVKSRTEGIELSGVFVTSPSRRRKFSFDPADPVRLVPTADVAARVWQRIADAAQAAAEAEHAAWFEDHEGDPGPNQGPPVPVVTRVPGPTLGAPSGVEVWVDDQALRVYFGTPADTEPAAPPVDA